MAKIQVHVDDLARVCADLLKQGIRFEAEGMYDQMYLIVLQGF
jgi:hypothetical protein